MHQQEQATKRKQRIVDPTLIHPTTTPKKRARNSTNRLSKATGKNNNLIEINDDTPTKQGKYWEQSKQEETVDETLNAFYLAIVLL